MFSSPQLKYRLKPIAEIYSLRLRHKICVNKLSKNSLGLLDYFAQNAGSQSRQGFQPLRAFGILIKFIMAVQRGSTHII